jgi:hypothetical protein
MTENYLQQLSVNEVFDLMVQTKKALAVAKKKKDETGIKKLKKQAEFFRMFLSGKRAEFPPAFLVDISPVQF